MLGNDVVLCIVGNKIDLEKDRRVSMQTAEDYAKSVNAKLYHTSAKLNKGVEELFNDLAQRKLFDVKNNQEFFLFVLGMLAKTPSAPVSDNPIRGSGVPIQPTNQNNEKREGGGCCQ